MYNKFDIKTIEIVNKNPSGLYLVSTPIGNKFDISLRALDILDKAEQMLCEDTRVTKNLFKILGLDIKKKKWICYNDHNAPNKITALVKIIKNSNISVLVSDAGSPLISDPGYKLVKALKNEEVYVTTIPGPCSVISSLIISGLKSDKFLFLGFLPKNKNDYIKSIRDFSFFNSTIVIFEKSTRIFTLLKVINDNFNDYKIVLANEVSKLNEKVISIDKNNIKLVLNSIKSLKGEITVLLEVNRSLKKNRFSDTLLLKELRNLKPSQVATMLSKKSSESRENLYKRCIKLQKKNAK